MFVNRLWSRAISEFFFFNSARCLSIHFAPGSTSFRSVASGTASNLVRHPGMAAQPEHAIYLTGIGNLEHRREMPEAFPSLVFDAIFPCVDEDVGSPPILCSACYIGNTGRKDVGNGTYKMTIKVNLQYVFLARFLCILYLFPAFRLSSGRSPCQSPESRRRVFLPRRDR